MKETLHSHGVVVIPSSQDSALFARVVAAFGNLRQQARFHVLPFDWAANQTPDEIQQRYFDLRFEQFRELAKVYSTLSLLGISGGASVALLLALQDPRQVFSLVTFCGCISPNSDFLKRIDHPGYSHFMHALGQELDNQKTRNLPDIARRTLTVVPKKDDCIPLQHQLLEGAESEQISSTSHLSAITVGLLRQFMTRNSQTYNWLLPPNKK